jgi:hypothetical protein
MDIEQIKNTIVTLKSGIDSQITGLTAQSEALAIAIQIIDGTLETQAIELKAQYEGRITTLETEKTGLVKALSDKEIEISALKVAPGEESIK